MRRTKARRASTRHVLGCLAAHMDADGLSYPGLGLLAKETGLNRSTIVRALVELEQLGELIRYRRAHAPPDELHRKLGKRPPGGWQATNYYHLKLLKPETPRVVALCDYLDRAEVVAKRTTKVVAKRHADAPRSLFSEVPLQEEPPQAEPLARPEDHKWFRLTVERAYVALRDHEADGIELAELLQRESDAAGLEVSADVIGAAIERALDQRRWALAEARRQAGRRRR